jgi:hypothetical protein
MSNRTLSLLGSASLALLFPCLFLALAAMPTAALAEVPGDPVVDCAQDTLVEVDGIITCRPECNVNSAVCVAAAILTPPCFGNMCPVPLNGRCYCNTSWLTGVCVCL